ncbi:hypothetical protein BJ165DRAFT_1600792 [Panaeolus papilionaceus]|nr:hypothetical protein BJ165DRAFT_1600792 [Panaeolus papilionaceus]
MITDYRHYRQILSRLKRPTLSIISGGSRNSSTLSLDSSLAYGLGSGPNSQLMCQLPCSNRSASFVCHSIGLMECSQYCSGRCQRQHWAKHRIDCEGPLIQSDWQPDWVAQKRKPIFSVPRTLIPSSTSPDVFKNPGYISYDCLRLHLNEGSQAAEQNFKLCMTSVSDIRNLVETVNSLPTNYRGRIDILMNNSNAIAINRMLVILCALLTPGPSIDESAELAAHLMYSISLPETAASYLRFCVNQIYGEELLDGEMSFQASLKTRGQGRIYSAQPSVSIKKPVEMFTSTYKRSKAFESYRAAMQDPFRIDDRHKALSDLQPAHRLSLNRFWKTGILLPFSVDLSPFSCPNRSVCLVIKILMFTAQGEWMGPNDITSPLHGWDINAVSQTSIRHGVEPSADIIGALFFHIKAELREFSLRIKEHEINIHITQYDSHLLSKGISIGLFPSFSDASFDRIDIGDMSDTVGVAECLTDWGPLLNKKNPHSTLLLHSKRWHEEIPGAVARENPRALEILLERCKGLSSPSSSLKAIFNGHQAQSPSVLRLVTSLDAFIDHESAFTQYLEIKEANLTGISFGLTLRKVHGVHPKRVGIPLQLAEQKLPNMTKEAFYETFIAGGADLTMRFAEFAHTAFNDDTSTPAGDLKVHQDKDTYTDIRTSEREMVIDFGSWNPGM